ncbi:MAG: hypothetical protein QOF01_4117, partial [Thermomicrobiales bacterium]|nr:hypothetical protein [Thermomicrobiales bacterium]
MPATVRFLQHEHLVRQTASLPLFTEKTGIEVAVDLLPADRFWHDARRHFGDP